MGKNSIGTGSRLNASALIQDKRIGYSRGDTSIRASLTGGADALLTANVPAAPSIVTTFVLTQEWVNEGGYLSRFTGTFSRYCPLGGTVVTNDYGTLDVNGAYLPMDGNPGDLQWIATDGGFQLHLEPLAPGATSPQVVLCLPANDSDAARYTDLIASVGVAPNFGTLGGGLYPTDAFSEPYASLTFTDWGQEQLLQNGTLTLAGLAGAHRTFARRTWTPPCAPSIAANQRQASNDLGRDGPRLKTQSQP